MTSSILCFVAGIALAASCAVYAQSVNNLASGAGIVYGSAGADGVVVLGADGNEVDIIALPPGLGAINDLSFADDLLFVLDAVGGQVGVYSAATASAPTFIDGSTRAVDVGPFAGVSAGGGRVVVSGGTGSMSVFSYTNAGALTLLTDGIDLGFGQPDVLVDSTGSFAYVSTDFAGTVDGASFGITTVDLNSADLSNPSVQQVGLIGSGFTGGSSPANFPVESAIAGNRLLVAHGGGLSILSLADRASPKLNTTLALDFPAVNVDAMGDSAVVVGGTISSAAASVDMRENSVENLQLPSVSGAGSALGVALTGDAVIVAAGPIVVCIRCIKRMVASNTSIAKGNVSGAMDVNTTATPDTSGATVTNDTGVATAITPRDPMSRRSSGASVRCRRRALRRAPRSFVWRRVSGGCASRSDRQYIDFK